MVVPSSRIVRVRDPLFRAHRALVQSRQALRSNRLALWLRPRLVLRPDFPVLAAMSAVAVVAAVPVAVVATIARAAAERESAGLSIKRQCHRAFRAR